jgi:5-methylcytosine-specific restriction enzyme subunit McrC
MKTRVTVREFASLSTEPAESTLDRATISKSAFEWLCGQRMQLGDAAAQFIEITRLGELRVDNYVGVIETPCGSVIEVLPKCIGNGQDAEQCRLTLHKMLARALDVSPRESTVTGLRTFDRPLTEWIAAHFLQKLERLVSRGMRFDYRRIEEQQRFLRGRLDLARQLRSPPGRQHIFHIQHDVFVADRAENRLLHSALESVRRRTREPRNWQLAHELATFLAPVPFSVNYAKDIREWKSDRLMAHYQDIRPWCTLILDEQVPLSMLGGWEGPSMLFPMEKIFERYVACCLRDRLETGADLKATARTEYLCTHRDSKWFRLEPDVLLEQGGRGWIVDAKWKRLDGSQANSKDKYRLSQDDFYQMFAYGHKYLGGRGNLLLVYPKTNEFSTPLEPFLFSDTMRLWVVPFDLEKGCLVGDLPGLPIKTFRDSPTPDAIDVLSPLSSQPVPPNLSLTG